VEHYVYPQTLVSVS